MLSRKQLFCALGQSSRHAAILCSSSPCNRQLTASALHRVIFGGFFIRGHSYTMTTLSFAIRFWSKVQT